MEEKKKLIQALKRQLRKARAIEKEAELTKDRTGAKHEGNGKEKASCASFSQSVRCDLCCASTLGLVLFLYIIIGGIAFEALALPARVKDIKDSQLRREEFLDAIVVLMAQDDGNMSIETAAVESRARVVTLMNKVCKAGSFRRQTKRLWTFGGAFILVTSVITTIGGPTHTHTHTHTHTYSTCVCTHNALCIVYRTIKHHGSSSLLVMCIASSFHVGYSKMHPSTPEGQYALIVFALFGIPLSTLFLVATGRLLKLTVQWGCCQRQTESSTRLIGFLSSLFVFALGISTFVLVPALVLSQVEGWAYLEAFYFTFMTLSTVGTVKIVPGWRPESEHASEETAYYVLYKVFIALWMITGLAYVSLLIQSVRDCEGLINGILRRQWKRGLTWMKEHRASKIGQKEEE